MRVLGFIAYWIGSFLALAALISLMFGVMHVCALAMYWGEGWMPKTPWFLWRFFVALSFFIALVPAAIASATHHKGSTHDH